MKVYKVTLMIVNFDGLDQDEVADVIESTKYPNHCISPEVVEIEARNIGAWDDSHPLNMDVTWLSEFDRLFGANGKE